MDTETKIAIEKEAACEAFIGDWIKKLPMQSELKEDTMLTIITGNLRHAWFEGSKFKPNAEDYTVEELTKFSQYNSQ